MVGEKGLNSQMETCNEKSCVLIKDKYYGPLLYSYIDTILRSGDLLEDDFQVILTVYRIDEFCINHKTELPYSLIASAFSLFPSLIASKKLGYPLLIVPPLIITTSLLCCKIYEMSTTRRHEILIENLVEVLKHIQDLNKKINKYLIERKAHSSQYSRDLFQPFTNTISKFIKALHKTQYELQHTIISTICEMSNFCEPLKEDCNILKNYQISTIGEEFEDYLKYTDHMISFQQLVTSKILSYIAISFSWEESTINKKSLEELLNFKIPSLVKSLNNYRKNIFELFESLRNSLTRFSSKDIEKRKCPKTKISSKLLNALDSSVNNISFVLEKLYNIIDTIEETDGSVDHKIDQALVDLRNHTAVTYETLDILCKIYGILLDSKKKSEEENKSTCEEEIKSDYTRTSSSSQSQIVKDPRDLIEDKEKYELYIKATDKVEEPTPSYGEASDAYLQIMIKELKKNLKQHKFYVSAKKRWKDDSEDEMCSDSDDEHIENNIIRRKNRSLSPKSNTTGSSIMNESKNAVENRTGLTGDSNEDVDDITLVQLEELDNEIENDLQKRDTLTRMMQVEEQKSWNPILQGIKNFSQNNQIVEETFGEDENSD